MSSSIVREWSQMSDFVSPNQDNSFTGIVFLTVAAMLSGADRWQ